jgi:U11/U12 small nuclear ribonucleoprotein SNRNP31
LSYKCPRNALGDRAPPLKKKKMKKKAVEGEQNEPDYAESEDDDDLSLGEAIWITQRQREADKMNSTAPSTSGETGTTKRKLIKPSSYFSDEDASD